MYVIKTQKLAAHLMTLGFKLVKTDTDKTNPNLNVFLFSNTPKLADAVLEYQKSCKCNNQ